MNRPDMNYDQAMARIAMLEQQLGDMRRAAEMLFIVLGAVGLHKGRGWEDEHPEWQEACRKWVDNWIAAERACAPPPPNAPVTPAR